MYTAVKQIIYDYTDDGTKLRQDFFANSAEQIAVIARELALVLARGNKILLCGNGGSAADAQHFAAELVNRFLLDRPPLPAIALTTDSSILTSISNDFGYEYVFSKQVAALGKEGDALIVFSTSGSSLNIINALQEAKENNMLCIGVGGKGSGSLPQHCDFLLDIPSSSTPLIQELHISIAHLFCLLIDYYLFENVQALGQDLKESQTDV